MRSTRIVYILIGFVIFLPWLAYNLKIYFRFKKEKKKLPIGRILSLVLVSLLIAAGVYGHYKFTIGYQVSLVAERAGKLFTQRVSGDLDLPGYQQKMQKQGLSAPAMATVSGEDLELAGFQRNHYNLAVSERSFPMDDGTTIMYLMHSRGKTNLYSYLQLQQRGYRWQVVVHNILPQEEFDKLNDKTKIRFLTVEP